MSRVFAATEIALDRRVVIKVLPPEMAEGVSMARFKREIQLAARLQNAHIVPVLTAGVIDDVPYYVMPYVEGESLRARLEKGGALPIPGTISVLRDVARALAYAHEHGVVHRDIKPDNILMSGDSTVVTDFGIAKALSDSRQEGEGQMLTHVGTSLGTPAYMAPEQAAADSATDHRADIYAFGVMGYELLAGRAPFDGRSAQQLLAAQMSERPVPIQTIRVDAPASLARLIMECLEKNPDDRPQTAAELLGALDQITTSSNAVPIPSSRTFAIVLLYYILAFGVVTFVARAAVASIGLPTWVLPGAIALMAAGLPVILIAEFLHRGATSALSSRNATLGLSNADRSTLTRIAVRAGPWIGWRKVASVGGLGIGTFALAVLAFMLMRAYGIGPAGSLFASGKMDPKDRLLVADFSASGADTSLGSVMSEAVRTDLGQSASISLVSPSTIMAALTRMQRPNTTRLTLALAREVAQREGMGAVVDGDIRPLGNGFVLTLRLLAAQSGDPLATYQKTIDDTKELLPAIDDLVRKLRGKIGESLKTVGATPALERVTTRSLEALKKYDAGLRALDYEKDWPTAIERFKQATILDTEFAMAYRKLGVALVGDGRPIEESDSALARAYRFRDRLPERERYYVTASYFNNGPGHDRAKAVSAWQSVLEIDSTDQTAVNNLARLLESRREFARAEVLRKRYLTNAPTRSDSADGYLNIVGLQMDEAKLSDAAATFATVRALAPNQSGVEGMGASLQYSLGHEDSAVLAFTRLKTGNDAYLGSVATYLLGNIEMLHGHINKGEQLWNEQRREEELRGIPSSPYQAQLNAAFFTSWYRERPASSVAILDSTLDRMPFRLVKWSYRQYTTFAVEYARAGRPDKARGILKQYIEATTDSASLRGTAAELHFALAEIALAERKPQDALREFSQSDSQADGPIDECSWCQLPNFGRAYDLADMPDSTIAIYERFIRAPRVIREDRLYLAGIHKRLGELYQAKGDDRQAIAHYRAFVDLWKDADAELQPKVVEVRERLARLSKAERS